MAGVDSVAQVPQRLALCIEYNGSRYNGWQTQKNQSTSTVQETLESALREVADHEVSLVCAGRTDTGVHATGQIVHFDVLNPRPDKAWLRGANSLLPEDIVIRSVTPVASDFHARFSAYSRRYRYVILNSFVKSAILGKLVTHYPHSLDVESMHRAAQDLLGENDFSAFRGAGCQSATPMRCITEISVTREENFVFLDIQANAFLLHMVRNITGVLLEIGDGRKHVQWCADLLASKDRTQAGITAPPEGLYLVGVGYPEEYRLEPGIVLPRFFAS